MKSFTLGIVAILVFGTQVYALSPAPPLYESVLFIGDDDVNATFGKVVDAYLRTIAVDVDTVAECDSTPSSWVGVRTSSEKPKCGIPRSIYEEVAKADPDLTVVVFGASMLKSSRNLKDEEPAVEKIIHEIVKVESKCVWIGPPQIKKPPYASNYSEGVRLLKKWVSKTRCDFIDSSKYQATASMRWANAVIREIEKSSRPTPRELQQLNLDPAFQGAPASDKAPR